MIEFEKKHATQVGSGLRLKRDLLRGACPPPHPQLKGRDGGTIMEDPLYKAHHGTPHYVYVGQYLQLQCPGVCICRRVCIVIPTCALAGAPTWYNVKQMGRREERVRVRHSHSSPILSTIPSRCVLRN
ncbi:hypothetical protein QQP08_019074 [Theobroma cacao]|nr:hypothetical protein QQP08_019074 [Theobroma cacao]